MTISKELYSAAQIALRDCMGLQPHEKVAVITDAPCRLIGQAMFEVTKDFGNPVFLVEITPRRTHGEEPPPEIAEMMQTMDLVLIPTSKSMTHTNAKRSAQAKGVRIATLPGVTEDMMVRCMNADYFKIAELTNKLTEMMDRTSVIRVKAPSGTDITMPVKGRKTIPSHGLFREKGKGGNLPTGEAFLAPLEGESQGVVVVDGSMSGIGMVEEPIRIVVKDGYAEEIAGGAEAKKLIELLDIHGRESRNVAEFGIGTNDRAKITGIILEDEKVLGTIHIAFGDNVTMGGKVNVQSHIDGLVHKPTVWFDDEMIMQEGKLLV
ncbi:MAG: aminopeptidase [Ignavibacteria bacterium]|nr:aminopeptidase [Ignavibacteria bacterium]